MRIFISWQMMTIAHFKEDIMEQLKIFENNEFGQVRILEIERKPWFVGKDVAVALGYANSKDAIASHVDSEDKEIFQRSENATFEIPNRGLTIINESGLYSLILSSKLPTAKQFKRWVTSEILPSIQKTGSYAAPSGQELLSLAVIEAQKVLSEKEKVIEALTPKGIFADSVAASNNTILIGEMAKILKQNGHDFGQRRLFEWLRENGYLIKRKGTDYNMPTQKSMEIKLFEIKESVVTHADGHVSVNKTPKVTGKGQIYFVNKFNQRTIVAV